jgi:hypothetical protein
MELLVEQEAYQWSGREYKKRWTMIGPTLKTRKFQHGSPSFAQTCGRHQANAMKLTLSNPRHDRPSGDIYLDCRG